MKFKTLLSLSAIFAAGAQTGMGELVFQFVTEQTYRQNPSSIVFRNARAGIHLRDGNFAYLGGCNYNTYWNAAIVDPCYPGTNAFVHAPSNPAFTPVLTPTYGQGPHAVITNFEPALAIEPALPGRVQLRGIPHPQSTFTIPQSEVDDDSALIIGTRGTAGIQVGREYRFAQYSYYKTYTSTQKSQYDTDVVANGSNYSVEFPALGVAANPNSTAVHRLSVSHRENLQGLGRVNGIYRGVRFVDIPRWVDGFVELDPRFENTIRWEVIGNSPIIATDVLYFNLLRLPSLPDPNAQHTGVFFPNFTPNPAFPELGGADNNRIRLNSPLQQHYTILPGLLQTGVNLVGNVTYERTFTSNGVSYDRGTRSFQLPIRLRNTMLGTFQLAFPLNTPAELTEPNADYDGDGYTNFEEWAAGSNPANKNSVPSNGQVVPSYDGGLAKNSGAGSSQPTGWSIEFGKAVHPESSLRYSVEVSEDLNTWTEITSDNPHWEVVDEPEASKLVVFSKSGEPPSGSFFRRKATFTP